MQIKLEHLTKRFGDTVAVNDLSITLESGKLIALLGPSGCGKTTTLNMISGILPVSGGSIFFDDRDVTSLPPEKRGIGLVFQNYALYPHMTVLQNICFPMEIQRIPKKERIRRAEELAEMVHITPYLKRKPAELSGGQQQRVAIARSLVSSDELIVLDEPITNLDAKLREEMILEIQMIQQNIGTTIIYITHDQEAALQLCDRIAIMQPDGQICQIGSDEEIIRRPANRFVYSFIGVSNFLPVTEKGGKVCLALGGEPVLFDAPPQGYVSGKKNVMGVRPMDIVFDAKSPIRATIQRDTFLGNQYDYQVELMGRELRVERNALDVLADPTHYEAGQEVGLKFLNVKFYEEGAKA